MSTKQLAFDDTARRALERGVDKVAEAVKVTLGPRGRVVGLNRRYGAPQITKDGVTVAKEIELEDPYENMGAQLCKEVASKTNDVAGDGTTTATVLAQALVNVGMKYVTAGGNPIAVKRGIDKAVDAVVAEIGRVSTPVAGGEQIKFVATIAGNDPEIGEFVSEAFDKVGKDGVITVEESKGRETTIECVEGMRFDRGYLSPHFVTDAEKMQVVYEDVSILVYEKKISDAVTQIVPLLECNFGNIKKPLIIIAEDIEGTALATLVLNRIRTGLPVCAVKAPGFGDRRKAMLEDIAVLTGATFISSDMGMTLDKVTPEVFGTARKVIISKDESTIVEGGGAGEAIQGRVKQIRAELANSDSNYDKEKLQERLAKLSGGVAVLQIGASTEAELKEKKDRYEDSISATKAAIEEGIVPGGGSALLRASAVIDGLSFESDDERIGADIVRRALSSPLRQIAANGGLSGDVLVEKVLAAGPGFGLNALTGEVVDLLQAGIVDPAKVTRSALQNAASIAGLVLTTEALVADKPEPKQQQGAHDMDY